VVGSLAGLNTGTCITGDPDCDDYPGTASATLIAIDSFAEDDVNLDKGEFVVLILDFGRTGDRDKQFVIGVPKSAVAAPGDGAENLGSLRAAKQTLDDPRNQFGLTLSLEVTCFNCDPGNRVVFP